MQHRIETMNKLIQKIDLRVKPFAKSWKSDNFMGCNADKSNIAIAILEKSIF